MLDDYKPICGKALLDCGAYLVKTGTIKELPVDDYIGFVNLYYDRFKIIATPDVIGQTSKTAINFKYFIKRINFSPTKIMTVYHLQSSEINRLQEIIEYSIEHGIEVMAIGGASSAGFTDFQRLVCLEAVYKILQKYNNPFKIHFFGIGDPASIRDFKPNSVDSLAFLQKSRVMQYHQFDLDRWKVVGGVIDRTKMTREYITTDITNRILQHSELLKTIDPQAVDNYKYVYRHIEKAPDTVKFVVINALYLIEFENYVSNKLKYDFTYYSTITTAFVTAYSGLLQNVFRSLWFGRCLACYPDYWEMNHARREKAIKLFG